MSSTIEKLNKLIKKRENLLLFGRNDEKLNDNIRALQKELIKLK